MEQLSHRFSQLATTTLTPQAWCVDQGSISNGRVDKPAMLALQFMP